MKKEERNRDRKVYRETKVDGQTDKKTDKRRDKYGEKQVGVETEREETHKRQGGHRKTQK